jgi:GDP-4-dehydro-6-deoxy-D-mannose reductase
VNVLITGATGFAGRHLVELLAARGAHVVGVGRRPAEEAALPDYVQADLTDPAEALRAIEEATPDRVFHLAALASVARSWEDPLPALRDNYLQTANVLEAVAASRPEIPLVVACSGEEYGLPERLPIDEDAPLRPRNPYAASKAAADLLAGFYADGRGLHVIRTRAFNHAGPGQSDTYVVSGLARQIAAAEVAGSSEVTVTTGNIEARRDFTDVRDVVRAYADLAEAANPGAYNVCSGVATPVADILAALAEHAALDVTQRTDPALLRPNEVMEIMGSNKRLVEATGWAPEHDLSRTAADTLDWWRGRLR